MRDGCFDEKYLDVFLVAGMIIIVVEIYTLFGGWIWDVFVGLGIEPLDS